MVHNWLGPLLIDRQIGRPAVFHVESSQGDQAFGQRLRILVAPPGGELEDELGNCQAVGQVDLGVAPGRLGDCRVAQIEQERVQGIAALDVVDGGLGPEPLLAFGEASFRIGLPLVPRRTPSRGRRGELAFVGCVDLAIPLIQLVSRFDVEFPCPGRIQLVPGHSFEELALATQDVTFDR